MLSIDEENEALKAAIFCKRKYENSRERAE